MGFVLNFFEFIGNLSEDFFGGFFFWQNFLGGIFWEDFWEDFFGRNSTKSQLNIEGIDLFVKILVFVKILSLRKGRKDKNLNL